MDIDVIISSLPKTIISKTSKRKNRNAFSDAKNTPMCMPTEHKTVCVLRNVLECCWIMKLFYTNTTHEKTQIMFKLSLSEQ